MDIFTDSERNHIAKVRKECNLEIKDFEASIEILRIAINELNGKTTNQLEAAQLLIAQDILNSCCSASILFQIGNHESGLSLMRDIQEQIGLQRGIQMDGILLRDWIAGKTISSKRLLKFLKFEEQGFGRIWGELSNFVHPNIQRLGRIIEKKLPLRVKTEKKFEAERVSVLLSALASMVLLTLLNVVCVCELLLSKEAVSKTKNLHKKRSIQKNLKSNT